MVLSMVDQGKEVTLAPINGGRGIRSRLAIGRGMSQKIIVE